MTARLPVPHEYHYFVETSEDHSLHVIRAETSDDRSLRSTSTRSSFGSVKCLRNLNLDPVYPIEYVQLTPWSQVPEEMHARLKTINQEIMTLLKKNDQESKLLTTQRYEDEFLSERLDAVWEKTLTAAESIDNRANEVSSALLGAAAQTDEESAILHNWYYREIGGPMYATREETQSFIERKQALDLLKSAYNSGLQVCQDWRDMEVAELHEKNQPEIIELKVALTMSHIKAIVYPSPTRGYTRAQEEPM